MQYCIGLSMGLALLVGTAAEAGDHSLSSSWIIALPIEEPPTEKDTEARESLLQQIESRQSDEFRRAVRVDVANRATGLPQDYDILLYGTYADAAQRIKIEVRGKRAIAEFCSDSRNAFRRGNLPVEEVNQRTREFLYGATATHSFRHENDERDAKFMKSVAFATHTIFFRVELKSQDPHRPLRLMTDARQPIENSISYNSDGVTGFSHSRYCNSLNELVYSHLPASSSSEVSEDEVVQRLESLASRVKQIGDVWQRVRTDRKLIDEVVPNKEPDILGIKQAFVESRILGAMAIESRAKNAAPILDQLGQEPLADRVRLVTADDSVSAMKAGLLSRDWNTYQLALRVTGARLDATDVKLLLEVAPSQPDSFRMSEVLRKLEPAELDSTQIATLRKMYLESRDERAHVAIARLLLWKADDDEIYRKLVSVALSSVKLDGSDVYSPVFAAAEAVIAYSQATGKRRDATANLIRQLLDRIPAEAHVTYSQKGMLAERLGKLGEISDLPRLVSMVSDKSLDLNSSAIHAIADLDRQRAIELAREQITRYVDDKPHVSYGASVLPYCDLIFWLRDEASTELLMKALVKHRQSPTFPAEKQSDMEALVAYLRADRVDERATAAVRFIKYRPLSRWTWGVDVGKQLVDEGADPKLCQPLLEYGLRERF